MRFVKRVGLFSLRSAPIWSCGLCRDGGGRLLHGFAHAGYGLVVIRRAGFDPPFFQDERLRKALLLESEFGVISEQHALDDRSFDVASAELRVSLIAQQRGECNLSCSE